MTVKVNLDKSVTITLPEFGYASTFLEDSNHQIFKNLSSANLLVAANAEESLILAELLRVEREKKVEEIKTFVNEFLSSKLSLYSTFEQQTFAVQQAEYTAFSADPLAKTTYVSALAQARGLTVAAYMAKIAIKVSMFATIQGKQYAAEDSVKAASTKADILAVPMPILM